MSTTVELRELTKRFRDHKVVDNLSFDVKRGEIFGLIGPNGAGKTTTLRMLSCVMKPTSGTAKVNGYDITDEPLRVKSSIGYCPEEPSLIDELNASRNLDFYARLHGIKNPDRDARVKSVITLVGLEGREMDRVGVFSQGMRKKLSLARALMHDPPVLLLDEPLSSVDPITRRTVRDFILNLTKEKTILISSHDLGEIEKLCGRLVFIKDGKLVATGTPDEFRAADKGTRRVEIRLTQVTPDLVESLRAIPHVLEADKDGDKIVLSLDETPLSKMTPMIIVLLQSLRATILEIREERTPLEDAFIRLSEDER
jgi:ABC-2 type transport system ATP-binding protein